MSTRQKIYIGGLIPDSQISTDDIRALLGRFPGLKIHDIQMHQKQWGNGTKQVLCFCQLEYQHEKDWKQCAKALNGSRWRGSQLRLEQAKPGYKEKMEVLIQKNKEPVCVAKERKGLLVHSHADDMSMIDVKNFKARKFWKKIAPGRLVRTMRIRVPRKPYQFMIVDPAKYRAIRSLKYLEAKETPPRHNEVVEPAPLKIAIPSPALPAVQPSGFLQMLQQKEHNVSIQQSRAAGLEVFSEEDNGAENLFEAPTTRETGQVEPEYVDSVPTFRRKIDFFQEHQLKLHESKKKSLCNMMFDDDEEEVFRDHDENPVSDCALPGHMEQNDDIKKALEDEKSMALSVLGNLLGVDTLKKKDELVGATVAKSSAVTDVKSGYVPPRWKTIHRYEPGLLETSAGSEKELMDVDSTIVPEVAQNSPTPSPDSNEDSSFTDIQEKQEYTTLIESKRQDESIVKDAQRDEEKSTDSTSVPSKEVQSSNTASDGLFDFGIVSEVQTDTPAIHSADQPSTGIEPETEPSVSRKPNEQFTVDADLKDLFFGPAARAAVEATSSQSSLFSFQTPSQPSSAQNESLFDFTDSIPPHLTASTTTSNDLCDPIIQKPTPEVIQESTEPMEQPAVSEDLFQAEMLRDPRIPFLFNHSDAKNLERSIFARTSESSDFLILPDDNASTLKEAATQFWETHRRLLTLDYKKRHKYDIRQRRKRQK